MADGESLLGQQLSAAVKIPYENIDRINDPVSKFMNAWQMHTAVKLKQEEVEGRMANLMARNRQLEINESFREKEFGLRMLGMQIGAGYKDAQLDLARDRMIQSGELGQERIDTMTQKADWAHQKELDRNEAQQGLYALPAQMASDGYTPGTAEYDTEYRRRAANFMSKLSPAEWDKVYGSVHGNLTAQALQQKRIDEIDLRQLKQKVGSELFGNPGIQDLRPIADPESLPDVVPPHKNWFQRNILGEKQEEPVKGLKVISVTDPQTGKVTNVGTATVKKLTALNQEYQALMERQSHTAVPRDDPEHGVYVSPPNTLKEKAQRIRSDPTASDAAKAAAEKYLRDNP